MFDHPFSLLQGESKSYVDLIYSVCIPVGGGGRRLQLSF